MTSCRIHRWALWLLLPLLALRAVVPVGFMLAVQSGGLAITLCPGVAMSFASMAEVASGHEEHAHGDHSQGHSKHTSTDAPCPFAVAGGAALSSVPIIVGSVAACGVSLSHYQSHHCKFGPVVADRARAPPTLPTVLVV